MRGILLCRHARLEHDERGLFGGGLRQPGTLLEHAKGLIDQLNAWHALDDAGFQVDEFTRSAGSMQFYDSVVVIETRKTAATEPPQHRKTGKPSF